MKEKKGILSGITLPIITFIAVFTLAIALTSLPKSTFEYKTASNDIIGSYGINDIKDSLDCKISESGKIIPEQSEAYIEFEGIDQPFSSVSVTVSSKSDVSEMRILLSAESGESVRSFRFYNKKIISFPAEKDSCEVIRIMADADYELKSVEFHSGTASAVYPKLPVGIIVICAFISVIASVIVFLLDRKLNLFKRISDLIICPKKKLLKWIILLVISILVSGIIEFIIGRIAGVSSNGSLFNKQRFIFIFGCAFAVMFLVQNIKNVAKKPENILLGIILISGSVMILVSPFGHCSWDTESHYKFALDASHIGKPFVITQADNSVINIDPHYWPTDTAMDNSNNIVYMNEINHISAGQFNETHTIAHIPSGIMLAVGRLLGLSFYRMSLLAKFPNLIIYALCCYFAVKRLKSGKMILSVIALFPINIFLSSAFSYDYWVTGFSLLGMAYFVYERQMSNTLISAKNTAIMSISFALASIPKLVYAPLMIFPFLIQPRKIKNKKKYYLSCMAVILVLGLLLLLRTRSEMASGGDWRGGSDVNSVEQVKFILANPLRYAKILWKFLLGYLSIHNMNQYVCNFAYLGIGLGSEIFAVLLIYTSATDKNEFDLQSSGILMRSFSLIIFAIIISAVATALYIAFTHIGYDTILGCQPRYIIPAIYPLAALMGSGKVINKMNRTLYNYLIFVPCTVLIFYNINVTMVHRWI